MQVGKTKDQGLYNKHSVAVHPGALVAGTLLQYNTIQYVTHPFVLICKELKNVPVEKNTHFNQQLHVSALQNNIYLFVQPETGSILKPKQVAVS